MNRKKPSLIKDIIKEMNENCMFIEKEFDIALVGYGSNYGGEKVAVYDTDKCIEILINKYDMDEIDAYSHFILNVNTPKKIDNNPIFINDFRNIKEIDFSFDTEDIDKGENISSIFRKLKLDKN